MPALHSAPHQIHAGVQLGGLALIVLKAQPRVAADLPQLHQLRQNLNLVLLEFLRILHDNPLFHVYYLRVVQFLLPRLELHVPVLLQLLRQILQHVLLHPAQNKGRGHPAQPLQRP